MDFAYIIAGAFVGLMMGMTGIGGGSLMTPMLLWFGVSPATAVGTDLLYASITKICGLYVHNKQGNIDWNIVKLLSYGSIPAALITIFFLHYAKVDVKLMNVIIKQSLGVAMVLTSFAIVLKQKIFEFIKRHSDDCLKMSKSNSRKRTITVGLLLGVVVTWSSCHINLNWSRCIGNLSSFYYLPID